MKWWHNGRHWEAPLFRTPRVSRPCIICFDGPGWIWSKLMQPPSENPQVQVVSFVLASGKRLHNHGQSQFLVNKSTINGPFSIAFCMLTGPGIFGKSWLMAWVRLLSWYKNHQLVHQDQWVMAIGSFKVSLVVFPLFPSCSGRWLTYPSEKYEFVSWDDDIPNIWNGK